ncbi:MAG: hypothetical protein KKF77_04230 [Proteobacteria bacterium]|nr:hypothetical protein [Pseudomonadota bacterium]
MTTPSTTTPSTTPAPMTSIPADVSEHACSLARELDALLESVEFVSRYMPRCPEHAWLREVYEYVEEYHESLEAAITDYPTQSVLPLILGQISSTFAPVPSLLTAMAPFHPQETGVALGYLATRFDDIITKALRLGAFLLNAPRPCPVPHEETTGDAA